MPVNQARTEHRRCTNRGLTSALASNCGFTLVEVLTALVMFGLLVTLMLPSLAKAMEQAKYHAAIRDYVSLTGEAKSKAIEYRGVSEVHLDEDTDRIWILMDTTRARTGVKDTLRMKDFGSRGIEIKRSKKIVCFESSGVRLDFEHCEGGSLDVEFKLGKRNTKVKMTKLGKVLRS